MAHNFQRYILDKCQSCEQQLRHYFGLTVVNQPLIPAVTSESDRLLSVQLTNFLYDTYLRLLMLGYRLLLIQHNCPASACLKLALTKFDTMMASSEQVTDRQSVVHLPRSVDLGSLSAIAALFEALTLHFDLARKNGLMLFLDLLLPQYVEQLPLQPVPEKLFSTSNGLPPLLAVIAQDYQDEMDNMVNASQPPAIDNKEKTTDSDSAPLCSQIRWLTVFQTLYRPQLDNQLIDHRFHHEQAYIPIYRFGDDAVAAMSMSSYIGNTMRRNIRMLYDFIKIKLTRLSNASSICPCVVIFTLFVRDHFRVYHSKSLPQTSFIQIYDDHSGKSIKISSMLIANQFPKINQWFNSINNQFVKKTGYARILYIDAYIRLIASSYRAAIASQMRLSTTKPKKNRRKRKQQVSQDGLVKRRRSIKKNNLTAVDVLSTESVAKIVGKRKEKMTLSQLFSVEALRCSDRVLTNDPQSVILSSVYRSGFLACKHRRVVRVYTQKRAHDESASLSIFCNDCHSYL